MLMKLGGNPMFEKMIAQCDASKNIIKSFTNKI